MVAIVIFVLLLFLALWLIHYQTVLDDKQGAEHLSFLQEQRLKRKELIQTVTSPDRGTWSEQQLICDLLEFGISSEYIFHDLYVNLPSGKYSQIDLLVITEVGILVFEVKDFSGWIYGKEFQEYWTQVLNYGQDKFRFYNPIMQNKTHIDCLKRRLFWCADVPIFSLIVFYGNCAIKTQPAVPSNTFLIKNQLLFETISEILNTNSKISYRNFDQIVNILRRSVENGKDYDIIKNHKKWISQKFRLD